MESPSHCQGKHSQTEASARTCALYSVRIPVPRSIRPSSAGRFEFRIGFPVETVPRVIMMSSTFRSQRAFMTASERTLFGIHWAERATRAFKSCSFECEWDKLHTQGRRRTASILDPRIPLLWARNFASTQARGHREGGYRGSERGVSL